MKKTLLLILPLLLLSACGDGKYEVTPDTVCYTYWTFSFGTRHDTLPKVDAKTFEAVKNWLGRDAAHVYYQNHLIEGCDPATLRAHKKPLCSDKNDYYYKGQPMHVADVEGFKVLKQDDLVLWAKDSRYAYYDTVRIQVDDVKAFHLIEWCVPPIISTSIALGNGCRMPTQRPMRVWKAAMPRTAAMCGT